MLYKAFISYSHAADGKLAPALQFALHRFARRWYALRAMRVFRDETNLAISPHLWEEIEKAMGESEFFLLLASPHAAASKWVLKEVELWRKKRSADKLLILVTDGEVVWDSAAGDFDWTKTTALPSNLAKAFPDEPLYLDFRRAKTTEDLSLNNPTFRDKIADIASRLQGRQKDELIGQDVREHRKVKRLTWSAVIALILLTLVSVGAAWFAFTQRNQAQIKQQEAEEARKAEEGARNVAELRRKEAENAADAERKARKAEEEAKNTAELRRMEAEKAADAERTARKAEKEAKNLAKKMSEEAEEEKALRRRQLEVFGEVPFRKTVP
jgi:hypothetical protein